MLHRLILLVALIAPLTPLAAQQQVAAEAPKTLSVVRVNVTNQPWDFMRPWGKRPPYSRRAIGPVIAGQRVLVTAELGKEYTSGFPMGRGNHGSLHAQDTHVPLVMVGVDTPVVNPRTVDIVPTILREFGVPLPDYMRPPVEVPREAS